MLLHIDRQSGVPIYRQVIGQIRRQIMTGRLRPGDQLISVRELAGQLKVNPMTVSKAYALLEMENLLERRHGIGLFVAKVKQDQEKRVKIRILEDILRKAATCAIQLGISQDQAGDLLAKLYRQYDSKTRRQR